MKAAVSRRYGPPNEVRIEEVAVPRPGRREMLVRVERASVNRTDCGFRSATPAITRAFTGLRRPRQPIFGTEFAGVVEEVGPEVTRFAVGDRVFGYREPKFGCHAEYVAVGEREYVATVPEGVSIDHAAAATEGGHYALGAIRKAGVGPGDSVLVYGASGAIGSAAAQLVPLFGADVIAVCGTEAVPLVQGLGVDQVIDYQTDDFTKCGSGFDFVLDAVGKLTYAAVKPMLGPRGIYCSSELGPRMQNPWLALFTPLLRGRKVIFPIPKLRPEDLALIRQALADGTFRPLIDSIRPLEEIVAAYQHAESGQKLGNILLTP